MIGQMKFAVCDGQMVYEDLDLCLSGIEKLFDYPVGVKTLWFSLHKRPSRWRLPVKVEWNDIEASDEYPELIVRDSDGTVIDRIESEDYLDVMLRPHAGKTLYLQLEYR